MAFVFQGVCCLFFRSRKTASFSVDQGMPSIEFSTFFNNLLQQTVTCPYSNHTGSVNIVSNYIFTSHFNIILQYSANMPYKFCRLQCILSKPYSLLDRPEIFCVYKIWKFIDISARNYLTKHDEPADCTPQQDTFYLKR